MTHPLPQHPANATIYATDRGWTITLPRELDAPIDEVWTAITEVEPVAQWTPFRPDHSLAIEGDVVLVETDGSDAEVESRVTAVNRPTLLEFTWGTDPIRITLEETDGNTALSFSHVLRDRESAGMTAAGWHICLDGLDYLLGGNEVPEIHGRAAMAYGWQDLQHAYDAMFAQTGGDESTSRSDDS